MKHIFYFILAIAAVMSAQAATIYTSDFIADNTRTNFNGFEGMGSGSSFAPLYTEGGITVQQISGAGNNIWTTYNPGGIQGSYIWYPSGGDYGYTRITLSSGADFFNVGMLVGSGNGSHYTVYFELRNNGALVQSGTFAHTVAMHYIGFGGGGFDEVLLRDGATGTNAFNGTHNALALDAIEVSGSGTPVPEPMTLGYVLFAGFLGILYHYGSKRNV